jgi:hypothetical protein
MVYKLLQGNHTVKRLLAHDPFPERPPRWIRVDLYAYHFTTPGQSGWWTRTRRGTYLPALSLQTPRFREWLARRGWLR